MSTAEPTIVTESSTASPHKGLSTGAIGGIIGGVGGCLLLGALGLFFYCRREKEPTFDDPQDGRDIHSVPRVESHDPGTMGKEMEETPGGRLGTMDPPGTPRLKHPEGFDTESGGRLGTLNI
jgi:hypothetical protein